MIRVQWYFSSGSFSHAHDYETAKEAFEHLKLTNMDALAYPTETLNGVYDWRKSQADKHTLELFEAKMRSIAS